MPVFTKSPSGYNIPTPSPQQGKKRKPSRIKALMNSWWDRLLGAARSEGSLGAQEEEYASHQTKRDYLWNSIGFGMWGVVFPLLTVVITQLAGVEQAGMFSLVFVTAHLLQYVGNYGVRAYQSSDVQEEHSFSDYRIQRWIACILMMLAGMLYLTIRGYTDEMYWMSVGVYLYKMVDALADCYEGRLQQKDKLYLAGISLSLRSACALVVFTVCLLFTGSLVVASFGMAIVAIISFVVVTVPLALLETPKTNRFSFSSVAKIFQVCFPLFVALFMYHLIDNMPKFVMEGVLPYADQLYFNALYFPAQFILIIVGFIYRPLIVRMTNAWADVDHRGRFDLFIVVMVLIIVAVTAVMWLFVATIGIPLMSLMYGVDFESYRQMAYIMLVAGGMTGAIDFLYQVITVLRKQKVVMRLYVITFLFSCFIPYLLMSMTGLVGAVLGYLIITSILFVLLVYEYARVRINYIRNPLDDPDDPSNIEQFRKETGRDAVDSAGRGPIGPDTQRNYRGMTRGRASRSEDAGAVAGSAVGSAVSVARRAASGFRRGYGESRSREDASRAGQSRSGISGNRSTYSDEERSGRPRARRSVKDDRRRLGVDDRYAGSEDRGGQAGYRFEEERPVRSSMDRQARNRDGRQDDAGAYDYPVHRRSGAEPPAPSAETYRQSVQGMRSSDDPGQLRQSRASRRDDFGIDSLSDTDPFE